jgi:hypothetical protein
MKRLLLVLTLASCAPPSPKTLAVLCRVDAVAQPVAVALAPAVGPVGSAGAAADTLLVHPAVVAACAKVGGSPTAVVTVEPVAASL